MLGLIQSEGGDFYRRQGWMSGRIHGVRNDFAIFGVADMAGKTKFSAFFGMAQIDHAPSRFFFGRFLAPFRI